jgi:hypothetical protein
VCGGFAVVVIVVVAFCALLPTLGSAERQKN